jgi:glycosyltransferase involved in cell wall biosynthesis
MNSKKILFIYDHSKENQLEGDGLWVALKLLGNDFEVNKLNLFNTEQDIVDRDIFLLGWGCFNSKVDQWIQKNGNSNKKGLCLSAYMEPNENSSKYNVIFYETEAQRKFLDEKGVKTKLVHAFGINTDIFTELHLPEDDPTYPPLYPKIWDTISVGSFSPWHRQDLLYDLPPGLAIGDVQQDNIQESFNYVANLLLKGWAISNWVSLEKLAQFYNMSRKFIATAEFGQERAVLEARACGIPVEVPADNPKLNELLISPIWDVKYYYTQLKSGIEEAIS